MTDGWRKLAAIKKAIFKVFPRLPSGNFARHLTTLAAFICGIVGSGSTNLPVIANEVPGRKQVNSREKQFARWLQNENIQADFYFLPFVEELIRSLMSSTLVIVVDGSGVGRGCVCLMASVIFKSRALPIAWIVQKGKKGHFPEDIHLKLLEQIKFLVPDGANVVFLGDGEFDGTGLQAAVNGYGWKYVLRTAKNIGISSNDFDCKTGDLVTVIEEGEYVEVQDALFTEEKYGPVSVICWWKEGCEEPIYLVTNMDSPEDACDFYKKRFLIETFFSDQKSRGFNIHKSHISDPTRLSRLLIASCLAYIWIVFLGVLSDNKDWRKMIHRSHRCDLSLFQLGLRLLKYFLREGLKILVLFQVPI